MGVFTQAGRRQIFLTLTSKKGRLGVKFNMPNGEYKKKLVQSVPGVVTKF